MMAAMDMRPLVTVIMPAYNAAGYIKGSVGSILGQSYDRLELIVVDDGSSDDTFSILSAIAENDSRLRPVRFENGGPAAARNHGLALMSGESEYVMFVDSDDELERDALEYALSGAGDGVELVIFGFSIFQTDGSRRDYFEPEQLIERGQLAASLARLYKANLLNQVWGKLYRAELLRRGHIVFQDFRWGEDRLFIFDCLEHIQALRILPQRKYRYIMHEGESLISRYYDKKFSVCLEIDRRIQALCCELGVEDDSDFRYMFAKSVFSCLTNLYSRSCALSREQKRRISAEIIGNEQVRQRCRGCSGGLPVSALCALIRTGSVPVNMAAFHAVALTGELLPRLFTSIKHRK